MGKNLSVHISDNNINQVFLVFQQPDLLGNTKDLQALKPLLVLQGKTLYVLNPLAELSLNNRLNVSQKQPLKNVLRNLRKI